MGGIEVRRGRTSVVETVERELAEAAPNESERGAVDQVAVEDAPQESNSTAAESNAVREVPSPVKEPAAAERRL